MTTVAVLGERALIQGYALAGGLPLVAETPEQARERWERLPPGVQVVVLTPAAAAALSAARDEAAAPMTVVMPA
ncbi:MAG TPA: hypothetical protein VFR23_21650 [Jiangellaceae bacterium]|nr:hypothetical protein [Jiangellaceae bacterium]